MKEVIWEYEKSNNPNFLWHMETYTPMSPYKITEKGVTIPN